MTDTFIEIYAGEMDEKGERKNRGDLLETLCVNLKDLVFVGIHPISSSTYVRVQMGYETFDYIVNESYENILARMKQCGTVQIGRR